MLSHINITYNAFKLFKMIISDFGNQSNMKSMTINHERALKNVMLTIQNLVKHTWDFMNLSNLSMIIHPNLLININ